MQKDENYYEEYCRLTLSELVRLISDLHFVSFQALSDLCLGKKDEYRLKNF